MADNRNGNGVKIMTGSSYEQLEDRINQFLTGSGDNSEDPRRELVFQPFFLITGGVFYALLYYKIS